MRATTTLESPPPAQERPERDVGDHPEADGLGQDLFEGALLTKRLSGKS